MVYKQSGRSNQTVKVEKLIEKALQEIEDILKQGSSSYETRQLEKIKREVNQMKSSMSPTNFQPSFPRMIVDSWDYNDHLGELLLHSHQEYNKLESK